MENTTPEVREARAAMDIGPYQQAINAAVKSVAETLSGLTAAEASVVLAANHLQWQPEPPDPRTGCTSSGSFLDRPCGRDLPGSSAPLRMVSLAWWIPFVGIVDVALTIGKSVREAPRTRKVA